MAKTRILLDSNAYLRLANSFHPLLNESFGDKNYTLHLIPKFQKEVDKNPRLINKFGWVNQPEYVENRRYRIRVSKTQKEQIKHTYSYLWQHNISEGIGASRIDVRALAYGDALEVTIVTDDSDMTELANVFGIEVIGLLELIQRMVHAKRVALKDIKALLDYLEYIKDLPYPGFRKKLMKTFKKKGG